MIKFIKDNWRIIILGAVAGSIVTQLYLAICQHDFPKELPAIKDLIAIGIFLIAYQKINSVINYFTQKFDTNDQTKLPKIANILSSSLILSGVFLFLFDNGNWIGDWINSAVAIGTIGAVITSLFLYNKSTKDNFDNMARSQRAFIIYDGITLNSSNNQIAITVNWKNYGITPATRIIFHCSYNILPYPLPSSFNFADINPNTFHSESVLGTGQGANNNYFIGNNYLLPTPGSKLFVWGWCEYNDVFTDKRRRTEFCAWIEMNVLPNQQASYSVHNYNEFMGLDDTCLHNIKT